MRILHLSDLHFGRFFLEDVAQNLVERAHDINPDAIVISGDLTQRARAEEFAPCVTFLDQLPARPKVVVPGNHDVPLYNIWQRLLAPLEMYNTYVGSYATSFIDDNVCIIGLDSTNPRGAFVNGRIGRQQLNYCHEEFGKLASNDSWRVLVMHHHLLPPPGYKRRKPMPRSDRLLDAIQADHVDIVLSGHLHRAYIGNSLDVHVGSTRSNGVIVVQCGTSCSRRGRGYEREKNSFNVIDLSAGEVQVTHWIYFEGEGGFVPTSEHRFAKPSLRPSLPGKQVQSTKQQGAQY